MKRKEKILKKRVVFCISKLRRGVKEEMDGKDGVWIRGEKSKSFEREKHSCLFLREQGKRCVCGRGGK